MFTDFNKIGNPVWQAKALCKNYDPRIFFTKKNVLVAKAICAECPVREKCLDWTLVLEKGGSTTARAGIYGGLSPNQRGKIALCRYGNCVIRVKTRKSFCSKEHKQAHLDKLKATRDAR